MNILNRILEANRGRAPERLAITYRTVRDSPFVLRSSGRQLAAAAHDAGRCPPVAQEA